LIGQAFGAQQGALGNITGLGAPEWWQPTYVQEKTPWGNFLQNTSDIMGLGADAAMMASGFGG